MKNFTALTFMAIMLNACTSENDRNEAVSPNSTSSIVKADIDQQIFASLKKIGKFEWSSVSNETVWSALTQSDNVLSVGYKPENEGDINAKIHLIDINETAWKTAREKIRY
jgi:PBP1b-binding outer membrane lipoprotein LpoB